MKHEELLQRHGKALVEDDDITITTTNSDRQYALSVVNKVMKQKHFAYLHQKRNIQKHVNNNNTTERKIPIKKQVILFLFI